MFLVNQSILSLTSFKLLLEYVLGVVTNKIKYDISHKQANVVQVLVSKRSANNGTANFYICVNQIFLKVNEMKIIKQFHLYVYYGIAINIFVS